MLFRYAATPHVRRHDPRGYQHVRSYKPWLRDEFTFQCVYGLCQERWFPDGDDNMSIDHVRPRRVAPAQRNTYENLVYACCQCNASQQDTTGVLDPCEEPFGYHLEVLDDGTIRELTPPGAALIRICRLDRPELTAFRHEMLEVWRTLERRHGPEAAAMRQHFFGLPANSPISPRCVRPEAIPDCRALHSAILNDSDAAHCPLSNPSFIHHIVCGLGDGMRVGEG